VTDQGLSEHARETLRFAVLNGMTEHAHLTGLQAGEKADMLLDDIMASILDPALRWMFAAIHPVPTGDALRLAVEMLAHIYHEWESGTPCFAVTEGSVHDDDPIGNAFRLGNEEDSIIAFLDAYLPSERISEIDFESWPSRVEEVTD
jgi:hypothetical protein